MPNTQAFEILAELDRPVKEYSSYLNEIQALHSTVMYFIGNESNQQFQADAKIVNSILYTSSKTIENWFIQFDHLLDAIIQVKENENPIKLVQMIYNNFQKLDTDIQHLINLVKVARTEILHIDPINFAHTGLEIGTIQLMTCTIERMLVQLHTDIFSECDVLAELYPIFFKVEV